MDQIKQEIYGRFSWDLCGVADSIKTVGLKVAMDKVKPFVSVRYGDLSVVLVHEIAI
jgi:hypothetical protein